MSRSLGIKAVGLFLALGLSGCSTVSYYAHLARGQMELLGAREDISELLADPQLDAELRRRLEVVQRARRFASETLHLPDNGSYTQYADLKREAVVWNVFATPAFSTEAIEQCFPITGCVAYRGYFSRERADAAADALRAEGHDVHVGAVPAYSTLGWFDDPVLSTMLHWDEDTLVETLFHELAHQQLFVKGDTAFNESFASFVGEEGLRQYRQGQTDTERIARKARSEQFTRLMLDAREQLATLYRTRLAPAAMAERKQAAFAQLRADYARLRDQSWNGSTGYDAFMAKDLNNASLLPFGLYEGWVPAFAALWSQQSGDWPAFYAAVSRLAEQAPEAREAQLRALAVPK